MKRGESEKVVGIGDRVRCNDERTGTVKWLDYGGVHVQVDATADHATELRVYRSDQVKPRED